MSGRKTKRGTRDLLALQSSGATSRVLNLGLVAARHARDPEYVEQPFFRNPTLNAAILVKHRIRADERYVFDSAPTTATKLILPFTNTDLTLGARSMFVGQRGWRDMLRDLCDDQAGIIRDAKLLAVIERLPSLDPFLLREQLKRHGFKVGRCYFAISPGDHDRMQAFVSEEISKLIELAFGGRGAATDTGRLVQILLSTQVDERLEPLRATLGLEGEAYREGVFSWKGFLYYKWVLRDLWPLLVLVLDELRAAQVKGANAEPELVRYIDGARRRLETAIQLHRREVIETLKVYDDAFRDLTVNGKPAAFREFLVKAPGMFMMLGERIGAISHIGSFWRYRFPRGCQEPVLITELADILQDFEASLGVGLEAPAPELRARRSG